MRPILDSGIYLSSPLSPPRDGVFPSVYQLRTGRGWLYEGNREVMGVGRLEGVRAFDPQKYRNLALEVL